MARQYSAKTFLRNVPNALLKEYFDRRGVNLGFPWSNLHETDVNPIFLAMEKLDERTRSEIDTDFRMINDLASAAASLTIANEGAIRSVDVAARFARMMSAYERAFWTFLHEPELFRIAGCFHEMDRRSGWRRRFVGEGLSVRTDAPSLRAFQKGLQLFHRRQGRGRFCHVDYYERRNPLRHCFFAYPEDYAHTDIGYDDQGRFQHRARRSAFEIIFVYRPEEGMLETCVRGSRDQVAELVSIFCQTILAIDPPPEESYLVPFDLSVLKHGDFPFVTEPQDGVETVLVRLLRLEVPDQHGSHITVCANPSSDSPRRLHDLLDQAIDKASLPLARLQVSRAKLRFVFGSAGGQRPKSLTFEVAYPDRCTLKDDPHDQIAKKYLHRWGIARDLRAA